MGLFHRISDIVSANLNERLDGLDDPEKMLKQAIREMEETIQACRKNLLQVFEHKQRLSNEAAEQDQLAVRWHDRAIRSVQAGDDSLARMALARKKQHAKSARALHDQVNEISQTSGALQQQLDAIQGKHAEAKRRFTGLVVRNKAAEFQARLAVKNNEIELDLSATAGFDRLQAKVEEAEAEAEALVQLCNGEALRHDVPFSRPRVRRAELAVLRQPQVHDSAGNDLEIGAELARLKKTLSG